ncbi:hypothetical protein HMPREF3196_02059 [Bifidobacterium bifidum]|uniref:Uncharacterized protein n=1 Tax=Bifidobacterium bifidum TaxID=1681 RepID=A0A133KKI2_BIFBI|nr:hypothetical protein HMPREF3196_02059 [Bifidobacterium bifidum]
MGNAQSAGTVVRLGREWSEGSSALTSRRGGLARRTSMEGVGAPH